MASPNSEQSFEQALERCLQDLARTGDIEACLHRYSQHADQLRSLLEMAQLARHYYESVPEPPGGLVSGRERLLAVSAQHRARTSSKPKAAIRTTQSQKKRLAFAMRFAGVLLAIITSTAALGGGVAWAAHDSLPGDLLYPVKITVEDTRMALTFAPQDQIDLIFEFAEERVEEIQSLLEIERQAPDHVVARMERHIEQSLVYAAQISSDKELLDVLGQIVAHTRAQAQILEQIQSTAPRQTQASLTQAVAIYRYGAEAAEIGQGDLRIFRLYYQNQQREPEPTNSSGTMTVTPGNDREHGQEEQGGGQEHEFTPTAAPSIVPSMTPQESQSTPESRHTPQGPQPTPESQPTPQGPQSTPESQPTPQGPQSTPEPPIPPTTAPNEPPATPHSQATPHRGSQSTPGPPATPRGAQATPKSQSTPKGP